MRVMLVGMMAAGCAGCLPSLPEQRVAHVGPTPWATAGTWFHEQQWLTNTYRCSISDRGFEDDQVVLALLHTGVAHRHMACLVLTNQKTQLPLLAILCQLLTATHDTLCESLEFDSHGQQAMA